MDKYGQTEIHPIALALTLAMSAAIFFVRRDRVAFPFLAVACLVTHAQRIVVADLDFSMLRIVILAGWARILLRGETRNYRFHPLDGALLVWLALGTLAYVVGPRGSVLHFVQRLGVILDAAGTYFLFRVLLHDTREVQRAVGAFGWLALVMVGPMIVEGLTGRNAFAALGGVPEQTIVRDGRLRCQSSFSHPIMAGVFGASSAALTAALLVSSPIQHARRLAALAAAVGMVVLSASSGPLITLLGALAGWALWPYRRSMWMFRWGTLAALVFLHLVREKPVWHLIGRLSSITGGTGWHRYRLIDEFVNRFGEWWLMGTYTTSHWNLPPAQARDITNQYVLEGVRGGLPLLLSYLAILFIGFQAVGRTWRRAQAMEGWPAADRRRVSLLVWGTGVCLATHSIAFVGVSYFGQLLSIFYLQLAMISSLAVALSRNRGLVTSAASGTKALRQPRAAASGSTPKPRPRDPVSAGRRLRERR